MKQYINREYEADHCAMLRIFDSQLDQSMFPEAAYDGKDVVTLTYVFDDADRGMQGAMTLDMASSIVDNLKAAVDNGIDVRVHCLAGLSRSGAIAQFGIDYLGFEDTHKARVPNSHVYQMMVEAYTGFLEYIGNKPTTEKAPIIGKDYYLAALDYFGKFDEYVNLQKKEANRLQQKVFLDVDWVCETSEYITRKDGILLGKLMKFLKDNAHQIDWFDIVKYRDIAASQIKIWIENQQKFWLE